MIRGKFQVSKPYSFPDIYTFIWGNEIAFMGPLFTSPDKVIREINMNSYNQSMCVQISMRHKLRHLHSRSIKFVQKNQSIQNVLKYNGENDFYCLFTFGIVEKFK